MPTLQARSFGAGYIHQASLSGSLGLGSLLPYPGLVPPGAPTVELKMGIEWGKEEAQNTLTLLLSWGWGLIPLESQRQEVETPGAGFFKTGFILIFIIFSVFP